MMLQRLIRMNIVLGVLLMGSAGLTLSSDTLPCTATQRTPVATLELAQAVGKTKWCCCGGCCGYATNCSAVPGCISC